MSFEMSSELLRFFRNPRCKIQISDNEKVQVVRTLANAGLETIADFQNVVVSDIVGYKDFHPDVQTALASLPCRSGDASQVRRDCP